MLRTGWAAIALALVASPAWAADDVTTFLSGLNRKLPVSVALPANPPLPPGATAKLTMPRPGDVALVFSVGERSASQTLSLSPIGGADFRGTFVVDDSRLPCLGRMTSSTSATTNCWIPGLFDQRATQPPIISIVLTNSASGPSWTSTVGGQSNTYAMAQSKPVVAPSAPAEPTQELFGATLGMFANLYSNLGPEYLGGRAGVSTVGGKTALSVINLFKTGRMNFDIERQVYGLKPEDSQDRWSFRFVANDKAKLGGFVWRTQYSKPLDSSFAAVTMLCASNIKDAVHHIDCWDQNLVELFGRDTKNVSVAFELKAAPPFQLDILPGIRNVFTTTGHPDAKASRPN